MEGLKVGTTVYLPKAPHAPGNDASHEYEVVEAFIQRIKHIETLWENTGDTEEETKVLIVSKRRNEWRRYSAWYNINSENKTWFLSKSAAGEKLKEMKK